MHKILSISAFIILFIPAVSFADIAPVPDIPCDQCIYRCFDCCTMQDIVPMPGCSSCYHKGCNFVPICDKYLAEHPDRCPDRPKPSNPQPEFDENNLPAPELNDADVDNTKQPAAGNAQPQPEPDANKTQVPPPVETKRSCAAMMYSRSQTGILALLAAFVMALLAYGYRRQSR